ncbi:MAG TPA: DNA primase [Candidatus Angelobacter sp.]|nr:DNA primase [Candidatus Angelobacter sp.]
MTTANDFKETVRQQADIVRIVGDYVQLRKAGAQNYSGLCPFHSEKTPSFSVHATRQFFHCFGCGKSGDVFKFIQEIEKVSFGEAVRLLAQKLGMPLPKTQYSSEHEAEDAKQRGQLMEMQERACRFFENELRRPEAAHAREYLAGRGLKEETIKTFGIGFAPDSGFVLKDRLKADFSDEMMRASGLFSWKEGAESGGMYSKFRNRVMFPIANENGKVIAFTGRTLAKDEKSGPKYLNSPETPIYSKSRVLYNLDRAKEAIRKLGYVIIVEGQMDCIAVYSAGFHNVVASSGTAFTETQVRLLGRFSKDIVVNFDPDTAGAAATDKSLGMLLEEEFNIRVLRLEAGFDPDLFIRKNGAEAYAKALKSSQKYFDYLVERALGLFPVRTPEGKKNAVNFLLPHIHKVPSRIVRDSLAGDIAQKLGIDSAVLRQEFKSAAASRATMNLGNGNLQSQLSKADFIVVRALSSTTDRNQKLGFNPREIVIETLSHNPIHEGIYSADLINELINGDPDISDPLSLIQDPQNQSLWARIVATPEFREDQLVLTRELVAGVLEGLQHQSELLNRAQQLQREIVEAERKGDTSTLLRLVKEKLEIQKKLAAAYPGNKYGDVA